MKVLYSTEVIKFLENLEFGDHARVQRVRKTFEDYGFRIGPKYIKKIVNTSIWELRAGRVRVFLALVGEIGYGVHAIYKKSQKTPVQDINLAVKRGKQIK